MPAALVEKLLSSMACKYLKCNAPWPNTLQSTASVSNPSSPGLLLIPLLRLGLL